MVTPKPSSHLGLPKFDARALMEMTVFGTLFTMWANVELVMEMRIKQHLNLSTQQACIVCGPLGGGAKFNLLSSLLAGDEGSKAFVQAVRDFQSKLGRNALAHGFFTFDKSEGDWMVVSRDVKNTLTVKTKTLDRYFEDDFMPSFNAVMTASGITDNQIHAYGLEIARLAQDD